MTSPFNWREASEYNRIEYNLPSSAKNDGSRAVSASVEKKRKKTPGYGTLHGISNKVLRLAPHPFVVNKK